METSLYILIARGSVVNREGDGTYGRSSTGESYGIGKKTIDPWVDYCRGRPVCQDRRRDRQVITCSLHERGEIPEKAGTLPGKTGTLPGKAGTLPLFFSRKIREVSPFFRMRSVPVFPRCGIKITACPSGGRPRGARSRGPPREGSRTGRRRTPRIRGGPHPPG